MREDSVLHEDSVFPEGIGSGPPMRGSLMVLFVSFFLRRGVVITCVYFFWHALAV